VLVFVQGRPLEFADEMPVFHAKRETWAGPLVREFVAD
jgi:hypothetical protein